MLTENELNGLTDQQKAFYISSAPVQREQFERMLRAQSATTQTNERSALRGIGAAGMILCGGYMVLHAFATMETMDQGVQGWALMVPSYAYQLSSALFWLSVALFVTGIIENRLIDINATLSRRMRPAAAR